MNKEMLLPILLAAALWMMNACQDQAAPPTDATDQTGNSSAMQDPGGGAPGQPETMEGDGQGEAMMRWSVKVGGQAFGLTLEDNETTRALRELLPMNRTMDELNGNEKYCFMEGSLPTDANNPGRIEAGDFMLYGDNCLVLFYKSFPTTYSYTRLGRVEDPAAFAAALGGGSVDVTIERIP